MKNHTEALHEASIILKDNSLSTAGKNARKIAVEGSDLEPNQAVDIPTCFDGSWSSRGWTARDGIASAIAESTGQVLDVVYKNNSCRECKIMKEKKEKAEITYAEYLDWYIDHEPKCYFNHDGSLSVSFYTYRMMRW